MPHGITFDTFESDRFVGLIEAIGAADHRAAAKNLGLDPANEKNLSREQVRSTTAGGIFREKCRGYGTGVDFGDVVRGLLELVRKHRVRIGAQYATLVINALCLDGMAGDLLPGYSVLDGARPLLSAHRWFVSRGIPVLGPFVFRRLCLPVAWRLKGLYDAVAGAACNALLGHHHRAGEIRTRPARAIVESVGPSKRKALLAAFVGRSSVARRRSAWLATRTTPTGSAARLVTSARSRASMLTEKASF